MVKRMREPSTWAGLAALAAMFGHGAQVEVIGQVVCAVAAAAAALLPEGVGQ